MYLYSKPSRRFCFVRISFLWARRYLVRWRNLLAGPARWSANSLTVCFQAGFSQAMGCTSVKTPYPIIYQCCSNHFIHLMPHRCLHWLWDLWIRVRHCTARCGSSIRRIPYREWGRGLAVQVFRNRELNWYGVYLDSCSVWCPSTRTFSCFSVVTSILTNLIKLVEFNYYTHLPIMSLKPWDLHCN